MSIRSQQVRLSKVFQHLVLLSLGSAAATQACSSSSSGTSGADAGSPDSSTGADGGLASDAGGDRTMTSGAEGGDEGHADVEADQHSCTRSAPYYTDASYIVLLDAGDASPPCDYGLSPAVVFVDYPCGIPSQAMEGCFYSIYSCEGVGSKALCSIDAGLPVNGCALAEGAGCTDDAATAKPGDPVTLKCQICSGRRPAGLRSSRRAPPGDVGDVFSRVSHFEAASVIAFERLHDELQALGAPRALRRGARRSARDEVRHARVTGGLARRFGGACPATPRVGAPRAPRTLARVALENAVEGCVRETFGAMVATWQAAHASDPVVRRAMARIAADETRHAALAWEVAGWAEPHLDARDRARIRRARARAVRELAGDGTFALPAEARRIAGLPSTAEARQLVAGMSEVWA